MTPPATAGGRVPGPTAQRALAAAGIVVLVLAVATSLALGTVGWFAVGFGVLTDCTNNYSCTETGCPPCDPAARWVDVGGVAQLLLALVGVVLLVRALISTRGRHLLLSGAVLLAASVATMVGTTWRAGESYCQPGTPGFAASYCPVDE